MVGTQSESSFSVLAFILFGCSGWRLTLRSFEAVHGLSRIVKLVPDKLATAIEICRDEELMYKSGSRLIDLITDLLQHYTELASSTMPASGPTTHETVVGLEDGDSGDKTDLVTASHAGVDPSEGAADQKAGKSVTSDQLNLLEIFAIRNPELKAIVDSGKLKNFATLTDSMQNLSSELKKFKDLLDGGKEERLEPAALEIVKLCDELWCACLVYLDFVHPVLIGFNRSTGPVDPDHVGSKKKLLDAKLIRDCRKLEKLFVSALAAEQ